MRISQYERDQYKKIKEQKQESFYNDSSGRAYGIIKPS
jgi:hypothetical protein